MRKPFLSFVRDQRGVAALEMAIALPFLLTMFLGVIEIANFVLASERADKMAYSIADLVTQNKAVTINDLNTIMDASAQIMQPFPFGSRGHVIITSVYKNPGQEPEVTWQYEGGGTLKDQHSNFGSTGFTSPLPTGFTMNDKDTVIIAEVFYQYPAFITDMLNSDNTVIYKYAFYKPRLGDLSTVQTQ